MEWPSTRGTKMIQGADRRVVAYDVGLTAVLTVRGFGLLASEAAWGFGGFRFGGEGFRGLGLRPGVGWCRGFGLGFWSCGFFDVQEASLRHWGKYKPAALYLCPDKCCKAQNSQTPD